MTSRLPAVQPSRAERVTLFEDRAEVLRRAEAEVPAGLSWLAITGVSVLLDDASLVAGVTGDGARALTTRVVRRWAAVATAGAEEIAAAEAQLREARRRANLAERSLARAGAADDRASALFDRWADALARVPRGGVAAAGRWEAAFRGLDEAMVQALDELAQRRREALLAKRERTRAETRLAQLRTTRPQEEAVVEIQVEAAAAAAVTVELTYRLPCAMWRPEHLARLIQDPAGARLELTTFATTWQRTGERWDEVACRFSTARPARSASPPPLTEDLLRLRRKSEPERRRITVEARNQLIALAAQAGARALDEMPGLDDGGEPRAWEPPRRVTLPGDGRPGRVEIAHLSLPCTVDRAAWPELGEAAHLRAVATLSGGPLLAGPVRLARGGEIVGRGRLGFVAAGEPFALGFGPDDGLRVRRRLEERRDTTPLTGTQKISRTIQLYLGNLGGEARTLQVIERLPVSEITEVTVELIEAGGGRLDRDGFLRFDLTISPGATRQLTYVYRVEAAAKVQISW